MSSPPPTPDRTLDARGWLCPLPVLRASAIAGELAPGSVLEVVGDDPSLEEDLVSWANGCGHRILARETVGGEIRLAIEIGVREPAAPPGVGHG